MPARAAASTLTHEITLRRHTDFSGWREAARRLLATDVPPEAVAWRVDSAQPSLFERMPEAVPTSPCRVPLRLVRLAEQVVLHADPGRFALLYRLLWRVTHGERSILARTGDRDVTRAEAMAAAVCRSAQRLRTLIRFRELSVGGGTRLVAWFEPEHHVLESSAPWFAARFEKRPWSIVTPALSVHGDDGVVRFGRGGPRRDVPPPGASEEAWRRWHDSVVGPRAPSKVVALRPPMSRIGGGPVLLVEGTAGGLRGERASRLIDRALAEAGLVTNDLHRVRLADDRRHAGTRLLAERARLRPGLVVALGTDAAEALLERPVALALERGRILPLEDGSRLLITADPAAVLAIPDPTASGREYRRLVTDLLLAIPFQRRAA